MSLDDVDTGNFGPDLVDLVRHTRELHDILAEEVGKVDCAARCRLGPVCAAWGANVAQLEALVVGKPLAPGNVH